MAITLVSEHTGGYTGGGTSTTWSNLGPGEGVLPGQVIVLAIVTDTAHDLAAVPDGWVQVGETVTDGSGDSSLSVIARRAGLSESGLVTVEFQAVEQATAGWCVLAGVDGDTMLDAAPVTDTGAGTSRELSITTVTDGAACLMFNGTDPSNAITMAWDDGITSVFDLNTSGLGHVDAGFKVQASAGEATLGGDWSTGDNASTILAAFRPGDYEPPDPDPGWVRASNMLHPSAHARVGIRSSATRSGGSLGVSAVVAAPPTGQKLSLWLIDSPDGPANGYELRIDSGSMELRLADGGESYELDGSSILLASDDVVTLAIYGGVVAGFVGDAQVVSLAMPSHTGPWYAGLEGDTPDLGLRSIGFGVYEGVTPDPPTDPDPPDPDPDDPDPPPSGDVFRSRLVRLGVAQPPRALAAVA